VEVVVPELEVLLDLVDTQIYKNKPIIIAITTTHNRITVTHCRNNYVRMKNEHHLNYRIITIIFVTSLVVHYDFDQLAAWRSFRIDIYITARSLVGFLTLFLSDLQRVWLGVKEKKENDD